MRCFKSTSCSIGKQQTFSNKRIYYIICVLWCFFVAMQQRSVQVWYKHCFHISITYIKYLNNNVTVINSDLSSSDPTKKLYHKNGLVKPFAGIISFLSMNNGGSGGIRTHEPIRTTWFRVRLVMTTSIRFRINYKVWTISRPATNNIIIIHLYSKFVKW